MQPAARRSARGPLLAGSAKALDTGIATNKATLGSHAGQYELGIGGNYVQGVGGTLTLPIDGSTPGTNASHLTIAGTATLAGTLTLNFTGSFSVGQKFVLIDAAGGFSGTFGAVSATGANVTLVHDATRLYITLN